MDIRRRFFIVKNAEFPPEMYMISYTSNNSAVVPYNTSAFGGAIIESNNWINGEGVIKFNKVIKIIGENAFRYLGNLTSITIPNGVVNIESGAFLNCKNLKYFYGKYASEDNRALIKNTTLLSYASASGENYNIPNFIQEIDKYAFAYTDIESATLSNNTTSIGNYAFYQCPKLINIIGGNIQTIGEYAFSDCKQLESIDLSNVTNIQRAAFWYDNLKNVILGNNILFIGKNAFSYTNIENLTIKNSNYCTFKEYSFNGKVDNVFIENLENWDKIKFDGFYSNPLTTGAKLYINNTIVEDLSIPASICNINEYYMRGCSSIKTLQFEGTNVDTGLYGFAECANLVTVDFQNVTKIRTGSFKDCTSLINLNNMENVTTIGNVSFENCSSLVNLVLSENVKTIGYRAFEYCTALETVEIRNTTSGSLFGYTNIFAGCSNLRKFIGPHASEDGRILFKNEKIIAIAHYGLSSYSIPNNYTNLPELAFQNCTTLINITIPNVKTIPIKSFEGCVNLTSITIGNGVTSIEQEAFHNCTSLTSITIPNSVTSIGFSVFYNCTSMQYYDFSTHESVPTLSNTNAFDAIPSTCKIIVPDALYDEWIVATKWSTYAGHIIKKSDWDALQAE